MNEPTGNMLDNEHTAAPATDFPLDTEQFILDGTDMSLDWLQDVFCTTDQSSTGISFPWSGETNSLHAQSGTTPPEPPTCQNPKGPCIGLATRLLRALRANSPSCLMGHHDRTAFSPRPVDKILSTTREASRAASDIVRCPCHESLQLQLLVTVICTEVVGCYRRCIEVYSQSSDTDMQSGNRQLEEQGSVLKRRFTIGDHQMESHLETRLIGQVLWSRLQEVHAIMDGIARNTRLSSPMTDDTYSAQLGSVHVKDSFLKTQLIDAERELAKLQENETHSDVRGFLGTGP